MDIEEFRAALLVFCGDDPTPVQIARVDLAMFLRTQIDDIARNRPVASEITKLSNALLRALKMIDGAKTRHKTRLSASLRPLCPPPSSIPRFVSKRKVVV